MSDKIKFFEKELMEKDALNRIRWDKSLNPEEFDIFYLDRILGLSKINFSEIEIHGDFFQIKESLIPLHRIRRISWNGKTVWEKRRI